MALSIRNGKAEKLARELAAESGKNLTQAITRALESFMGSAHRNRLGL
jgi:hypothetical protein